MHIIISPSKTINPKSEVPLVELTQPRFSEQADLLAEKLARPRANLAELFGVSDAIAEVNKQRFLQWNTDANTQTPAAWTYRGETFFGLSIEQLSAEQQARAQEQLSIVSGLYGLLRPADAMQPYRLEMKTRLAGKWGKNLYDLWGDILAKEIETNNPGWLLNCASNEYSKAVIPKLSKTEVITAKFLSPTPNGLKAKMAFAKYSRGLLARWAIEHQPSSPAELSGFNYDGYKHSPEHSTPDEIVFIAPANLTLKGRLKKT